MASYKPGPAEGAEVDSAPLSRPTADAGLSGADAGPPTEVISTDKLARRVRRGGRTWTTLARQVSPKVLLLGVLGAIMITISAAGAGAVVIQDPLLNGTLLSAVRYGHGRDLATALFFLGLALLIVSWVRLGRMVRDRKVGGRGVLLAALAWITPLLVAPPLFSKDVYSYLAQGAVADHGFDPYTTGASVLEGALSDNVASLWQDAPSPYGPIWILLCKAVVAVIGDNVIVGVILMRLLVLVGLVLLAWVIPGLVRHLGGRTSTALWLTVANPFMITVVVAGVHNDLLMVGLMAVGVLLVLDRRHVLGICVVTLAVAVKATAALLLPFLLWVWVARLSGAQRVRFLKAAVACGAIFAGVFALSTVAAGVDLGWIGVLRTQTPLLTWMSLPCALAEITFHTVGHFVGGFTADGFFGFFRPLGLYVFAVVFVRQWWLARSGGTEAIRRAVFALLAATVLAPSVLPWYLVWVLALAAAFAWSDKWLGVIAGASVWAVLVTMPEGTVVARWPYGAASPVIWWAYFALIIWCAVLVSRAISGVEPTRSTMRLNLQSVRPAEVIARMSTGWRRSRELMATGARALWLPHEEREPARVAVPPAGAA